MEISLFLAGSALPTLANDSSTAGHCLPSLCEAHDGGNDGDRPLTPSTLYARFGKCADCLGAFQDGELILWHLRTRETLNPQCCVEKHPHLADWMVSALAPASHARTVEAPFVNWLTSVGR